MLGSIYGYVVRADTGAPVAAATVKLSSGRGSAPAATRSTDAAGWFTFDALAAGRWRVAATGPLGGSGEATASVLDNAVTEVTIGLDARPGWPIDDSADPRPDDDAGTQSEHHAAPGIVREPTRIGSVRGRVVRGRSNVPVADATIGILRGSGPAPDIAPMTDAAGHFAMDGLPWGDWVLSATDAEGRRGHATVHVRGYVAAEVVIRIGVDSAR